jgi:hypothetical protein
LNNTSEQPKALQYSSEKPKSQFMRSGFLALKARGFSFGLVISSRDDGIKQAMTVSLLMSYSPFS